MSGGIDDGYSETTDNIRDGLEMLVRFYDNHGQLKIVAKETGVPIKNLRSWLDGGNLSQGDRELLCKDVDPAWTGKVKIT